MNFFLRNLLVRHGENRSRWLSGSHAVVLAICFLACSTTPKPKSGEGIFDSGKGKIWYRISGTQGGIPLVLLHGGPGSTSAYLDTLHHLGKDRLVIQFDQPGSGLSSDLTDTTLMTIPFYVQQTRALLEHLGIREFVLYGHSWGTMLGIEYYLEHPEGIKAMVMASPCLSAQRWLEDADSLIRTLPDSVANILLANNQGQPTDSIRLANATRTFYEQFYQRTPAKASSDSLSLARARVNDHVYRYMWGPSEFYATGTLRDFDRTAALGSIAVPVLFTAGAYDEASPPTVRYYQSLTPKSIFQLIPDAGHCTMQDNPAVELSVLQDFLSRIDQRK